MTSEQKQEELLFGIASLKGWNNPDSQAWELKNPLLLPSFARAGKHEITETGLRKFTSSLAGIKSCLYDIKLKVNGESRAGIKKDDKLSNVLRVYGITEKLGQQQVVKFLKRALKNDNLTTETPLSFFRESSPEGQ